MYATTIAPVNGLNSRTIPKATACDEKMNAKFLFQRFSCHGSSGLISSCASPKSKKMYPGLPEPERYEQPSKTV